MSELSTGILSQLPAEPKGKVQCLLHGLWAVTRFCQFVRGGPGKTVRELMEEIINSVPPPHERGLMARKLSDLWPTPPAALQPLRIGEAAHFILLFTSILTKDAVPAIRKALEPYFDRLALSRQGGVSLGIYFGKSATEAICLAIGGVERILDAVENLPPAIDDATLSETLEWILSRLKQIGLVIEESDAFRLRAEIDYEWLRLGETGGGEVGTPPADPFAELRQFARDELKGQERAVIEALCDAGGELPIANLAIKDGVGWDDVNKGFESAQRRLNQKIKKQHWKLTRQNNAARLTGMPA